MQCQFGATTYRLKATVHRQGAFTPRITASREVVLVAAPSDDDLGDVTDTVGAGHGVGSHLHVERQWETQLRYLMVIGGRGAPIGGSLPIWITLMPLSALKVYRISVVLEERVVYYAHKRQVVRHDPLRRWELLTLKNPGDDGDLRPILPVDVEASADEPMEALAQSPLFPYVCADPYSATVSNSKGATGAAVERQDNAIINMLSPEGPWMMQTEVTIPSPCGRIHSSNRHPKANAGIHHLLKIIVRVERADETEVDPKTGRNKQFDIVVQTAIQVLSCRCNPDWTSLPTYHANPDDVEREGSLSCVCVTRRREERLAAAAQNEPTASGSRAPSQSMPYASFAAQGKHMIGSVLADSLLTPAGHAWMGGVDGKVLPENSRRFERLVSGLESPTGEEPPRYAAPF